MDVGGLLAVLIIVAGLNGPLAVCALVMVARNGLLPLRPEFGWLSDPWVVAAALVVVALQLYTDLYFVPITVSDGRYLHPRRTHNAYLHARMQSLFRPLCGALIAAAIVVPAADWLVALFGFCGATALYWLWAWVREYVARTRGTLVLSALETAKNGLIVPVVLFALVLPLVALVAAAALIAPTAWWTARLQREYRLYAGGGNGRAGEDA